MVSHDLRTPLTSIQCFLNLVGEGHFNDMEPLKENARMIENEATRLINMINNLLNIDRIESGGLEMFIDAVPLSELYRELVNSSHLPGAEPWYHFAARVAEGRGYLLVDRDFAIQVLVNLCRTL